MVSQASEETSPQSSGLSARVTGRITTPVRWPRARWLRILGVALLVGVYCALWNVVARFPIDRNDLDAFFVPAARIVGLDDLPIPTGGAVRLEVVRAITDRKAGVVRFDCKLLS